MNPSSIDQLPAGTAGLSAEDLDRDGRTDLSSPSLLLYNRPGRFEAKPGGLARAATADFDGNGRLAIAHTAKDGALTLEHDTTPNYGNWIEVALTGVKNLKSAVGAKVEVKAGTVYAKQTYAGVPLIFRLGAQKEVETIRIPGPTASSRTS